jgi:hypothetical protein
MAHSGRRAILLLVAGLATTSSITAPFDHHASLNPQEYLRKLVKQGYQNSIPIEVAGQKPLVDSETIAQLQALQAAEAATGANLRFVAADAAENADADVDAEDAPSKTEVAAQQQASQIQAAAGQGGKQIDAAWSAKSAEAREIVGEAASESKERISRAGGELADKMKKTGKAVAAAAQKNAKAAAKKVGEGAKYVWDHRQQIADKGRKAARAAVRGGKQFANFALEHKQELSAIGSALRARLSAAAGDGKPKPTMTDLEWCNGCQLVLSQVLEHTSAGSSEDDMLFALHSACHETPPVLDEACDVLMDRDTLTVQQLLLTQDTPFVCQTVGMCYPELLDGSAGAPADAGAAAKPKK